DDPARPEARPRSVDDFDNQRRSWRSARVSRFRSFRIWRPHQSAVDCDPTPGRYIAEKDAHLSPAHAAIRHHVVRNAVAPSFPAGEKSLRDHQDAVRVVDLLSDPGLERAYHQCWIPAQPLQQIAAGAGRSQTTPPRCGFIAASLIGQILDVPERLTLFRGVT